VALREENKAANARRRCTVTVNITGINQVRSRQVSQNGGKMRERVWATRSERVRPTSGSAWCGHGSPARERCQKRAKRRVRLLRKPRKPREPKVTSAAAAWSARRAKCWKQCHSNARSGVHQANAGVCATRGSAQYCCMSSNGEETRRYARSANENCVAQATQRRSTGKGVNAGNKSPRRNQRQHRQREGTRPNENCSPNGNRSANKPRTCW